MSLKKMLFAACAVLLLLGVRLSAGGVLSADGVHPWPDPLAKASWSQIAA